MAEKTCWSPIGPSAAGSGSCEGGDARRGQEQAGLPEPPQTALSPFIVYADFEALTTKVEGPELDLMKSNTRKTQHHEACSYYYVIHCNGQTEPSVEYSGPNAAEHFLKALQEEERKIITVLANTKAMQMTREDWRTQHRHHLSCVCKTT